MNFEFSDELRVALSHARAEAIRLGSDGVGTEHALLGVLGEGSPGAELLAGCGVAVQDVRAAIEARVEVHAVSATSRRGELPYTSGAKKLLEISMKHARDEEVNSITVRHLLMALAADRAGRGGEVLRELGVTAECLRGGAGEAGASATARAGVRLDDTSGQSIYEQIVEQIRERIATGGLEPGERLPTVRRLADHLDIAPGTVARAYRELERRGLVVTQGARGTRVAERTDRRAPDGDRPEMLVGLLRPVAVAGYHLGATGAEMRSALEQAMVGIFEDSV